MWVWLAPQTQPKKILTNISNFHPRITPGESKKPKMKFINQLKFSCQWPKNSISIFKSPYPWMGSSLNPLLHPFLDKNLLDMQSCWREHTYMWQYAMYGVVYQQKPSYQVNNQQTKNFRSVTFSWKVAILKWGLLLTLTILLLHPNLQHKWWNSIPDTHFICPYTKSGGSRRTMLAAATTKRFWNKILSFLSIGPWCMLPALPWWGLFCQHVISALIGRTAFTNNFLCFPGLCRWDIDYLWSWKASDSLRLFSEIILPSANIQM